MGTNSTNITEVCGQTINVTNLDTGAFVLAQIVDECLTCDYGYLALSKTAFENVTKAENFTASYVFTSADAPARYVAPVAAPSSTYKAAKGNGHVDAPSSSSSSAHEAEYTESSTSSSKTPEWTPSSSSKKAEWTPSSSSKTPEWTPSSRAETQVLAATTTRTTPTSSPLTTACTLVALTAASRSASTRAADRSPPPSRTSAHPAPALAR